MVKAIIIIVLLSFMTASNLYAKDSDRIDQLEKEIQELDLRISKLESLLNTTSSAQEIIPSNEGWKSISNWRKLSTGMDTSDVRKILGEPERLDGGMFATWHYGNGGMVIFREGEVDRWQEPLF